MLPLDLGEPISTRLDEVGGEVTRIVGLTQEQFVQTVVLPQGEFATFLRSAPEVRRELLQRLFGTEIYDRVLDRLVDQRKAARQCQDGRELPAVTGAIRAYCGAAGLDEQAEAALVAESAAGLREATTEHVHRLRQRRRGGRGCCCGSDRRGRGRRARRRSTASAREQARQRLVRLRGELAALDSGADQRDG